MGLYKVKFNFFIDGGHTEEDIKQLIHDMADDTCTSAYEIEVEELADE